MIASPRSSGVRAGERYRLYSSGPVPKSDQFDYWREIAQSVFGPLRIDHDESDGFRMSLAQIDIGPITLSSMQAQAHRASRDLSMARRSTAGLVYVNIPVVGSLTGRQRATDLAPTGGWLGLLLGHEPATLAAQADFRQLVIGVPAELVVPRLADGGECRVVAGALTGLVGQMARYMFLHGPEFTVDDSKQAAGQVVDLLVDCFGSANSAQQRARSSVILQSAMDEAERRLTDPSLDTDQLARHTNVSRRTLEKLFADRGTSVARWILQRRLERARLDLESEFLATVPIEAIAQRWAFADRTHFSRVFRERYDVPPGLYRRARASRLLADRSPAASADRNQQEDAAEQAGTDGASDQGR